MNSSALIDHLGWVLIHSLWQFAAIALVAGLLTWMLRWSTSTARYAIEVFAMGLVIAAPLVTWWALPMEEPTVFAAVPETANESLITFPSEGVSEPSSSLPHTWVEETTSSHAAPTDSPVMAAAPVIEPDPSPTWSETVATILHPWMMWIVAGWCAGVVFCSLRPLLGWHTLRRLRTSGVAPVSDEIRMALMRVADRLGLPQSVQVLQSTLAQVPVVVGYLRPVILLPVSLLANLPPSQLEAILAHELAHIRRHDFVINLLQTLVETLCFYHPAVWWLSRRIRIEREHCCDDLVVAVLDNRVEYGRALLAVEELRGIRTLLALGANDGSLVSRIRRIAGFRSEFPTSSPWPIVGVIAGVMGMTFAVAALHPEKNAEAETDLSTLTEIEPKVAKLPPRPLVAEYQDSHSLEFVGLTKNTAPANNGWQANGLPIGDVGYWKSTTVLHGEGRNSSTYTENGPHPEPDANAIDFLFRFRGLKAQPSLTFEMPTRGVSYSHLPVQEPYDLRVSAWRRPPTPGPGGKWSTPDGVVKVGLTDEPWGRYVKISPDGEVLNPIQADELYASTYKLIGVRGSQPRERIPNGKAILIREPSANTDPDDPDHRFAFEFRAIDIDGKEHWAMQWEGRGVEQTKWTDSQYGLSQPLPPGKTLSHYEYRLRPFRHWITFENVLLEPGPQTEVKYSVKSWPAAASKLKVTNADGSPATFNAVNIAQVGFPLTPLHPWIGWRERDGLVPLQTMPFGTHWILAAGEFEQRTIFPLAYPTGMKTIERALRGREPWTKHDPDFKPRFEPAETPGGTIVIRMKNKFEKPLTVSEADFNLVVGERTMHRGLSPQWSDGKFTPVEIAAGQNAEVRLNWNDWVQKGFWASRDGEEIAEPTLPLNEPGRIYVRVCLGNSGALPIAVTDPATLLGLIPDPFEVLRVGQTRMLTSAKNVKQYRIDGKVIDVHPLTPRTLSFTGVAAGLTVLTAINEDDEVFQQPIEVTTEASSPNAETNPLVFLPRNKRSKSKLTSKEQTLSLPVLSGVDRELQFPETIQSVEGFDNKIVDPSSNGRILIIHGYASGKTTITVKTVADGNTEPVHVWLVEVQVEQPSRLQLQKIFSTDEEPKTESPQQSGQAKDQRTSLLESLIQQPKLETLQTLLAFSEDKSPTPTELLDDSRRHSGKEKMGGEVKIVNTGKDRFAIVSAKVIPLINPSDVAIHVDPERRAECAFVFDMQGRLIDTIGGKLSGGNSLGGDDIHIVNLGPEEDWFVRVMNFEKRGELTYRSDYYRIANPMVKSFRFYNHPNSCAWSHGPEKIPRQGRLHPAHPQAQRPAFAGVPKQFPVTTAAGVPTVSTIVWDGDRDRWVAAPTAFVKGLPLYEVDTTWSREFEPLEPQAGQLTIEGGVREFDHWHAWEAAVPDGGDSTVALTIPQRDGPPKVIEQKLAPGRHTVQLQAKPKEDGRGGQLKLWIDDDQKFDFDLPFVFGEAFANHPPIVHVLKPNESARLVHRLLKGPTATLRFEIRLSVPARGISESPNP